MSSILKNSLLAVLKPPPKVRFSDWIEESFRIPQGKVKLIPYQKAIADALGDPNISSVVWQKAARTGATMLATAFVCFEVTQARRIGYLLGTQDDCNSFSASDLTPALRSCPETRQLTTAAEKTRKNRTTLSQKIFGNGSSITLCAANSPRTLRRISLDTTIADEQDSFPVSSGSEGDPTALFWTRAMNSPRSKRVAMSTPTDANSAIVRAYEATDQRKYFVPCPHCGERFVFSFDTFVCRAFDRVDGVEKILQIADLDKQRLAQLESPEAGMRCPSCREFIDEQHKGGMIAAGEWRATNPHPTSRNSAGFHLSALYSPFPNAGWSNLLAEWIEAQRKGPEGRKVFFNTVLGEPYTHALAALEPAALQARGEDWSVGLPAAVAFLTAGVDVQKNRVEITVVGSCPEGWAVVDHVTLTGDPTGSQLYADLDNFLLTRRYKSARGGELSISAVAVDSGNWTQKVYEFCAGREFSYPAVIAIKGVHGPRPILAHSKQTRLGGGLGKLHLAGVDTAKHELARLLAIESPDDEGYFRFSATLDEEYFKQLCGEELVPEVKGGRTVEVWKPVSARRHESWDCLVYAYVARKHLYPDSNAINWQQYFDELDGIESVAYNSFAELGRRARAVSEYDED